MKIRTEARYNNAVSILRGPLYYSLRIGKKYNRIQIETKRITSIDYMGSTDWEIRPTTAWNYGVLLDTENPEEDIIVEKNIISRFPFADADELVYSQENNRYVRWKEEAPIVLKVMGKRIPGWKLKNNSADDPPKSPVKSNQKTETLELVPYGSARLRITEFPLIDR
jgi:hypothetical protein